MIQNDFHKQCRIVYRAMRKLYGKEKVQDECLRVFKVVFPLLHMARTTEEYGFTPKAIDRIGCIFDSWHVEERSVLRSLLETIMDRMNGNFYTREQFITFCEDINVVVMRIRKLTPRCCFRLQGVGEKDIDTILSSGVSKSACYRLAGNSISAGGNTKNSKGQYDGPMYNMFRKLFIETEPDMVKGEAFQLSLF